MKVVVRRSSLKMWLMAMGGVPLLVISLDVLTERRMTRWLTDYMFEPEDVQIFEPRDVIFAWVMLLFGLLFVGWGLKELFMPTKVIECTDQGIALRLGGPFRSPSFVPWANVQDVGGADIDDEGDMVPLLILTVYEREGLPDNPWGARWVSEKELGILAEDFGRDPQEIATDIANYAVDAAKRGRRERTASLWQEP